MKHRTEEGVRVRLEEDESRAEGGDQRERKQKSL